MFWLVFALFLLSAILLLARPFYGLRGKTGDNAEIAQLQAELLALNASAEDGEMSIEDVQAARTDIGKRLLAAETAAKQTLQPLQRADRALLLSLGVLVIAGAGGLYFLLGQPGLSNTQPGAKPAMDLSTPVQSQAQKREDAMAKLNQHLAENPDDVDAWRTLGWADMQERNFEGAVAAYKRALELAPEDGETMSSLGEAMGMAAGGEITPAAKTLFEKAVQADAKDARARFYLGLAKQQAGDKQGALNDWLTLLRESPADAPFRPMLLQQVQEAAKQLGVKLPDDVQAAPPASPGPTAEDIKAVQSMSPEERQQMIEGMVSKLAARLQDNPDDLQGWQQLIRSLVILKHEDRAKQALQQAKTAFKSDPAALAQLDQLAKSLHL